MCVILQTQALTGDSLPDPCRTIPLSPGLHVLCKHLLNPGDYKGWHIRWKRPPIKTLVVVYFPTIKLASSAILSNSGSHKDWYKRIYQIHVTRRVYPIVFSSF
jgi:hypothetical protein